MLRHANILPNLLSFLEGDEMWSVTYPQTGAYLAYQVLIMKGTLKEILKTHFAEGFNEVAVATILKDVLKGLQYIHGNNMIHKYVLNNEHLNDNVF